MTRFWLLAAVLVAVYVVKIMVTLARQGPAMGRGAEEAFADEHPHEPPWHSALAPCTPSSRSASSTCPTDR